MYKNLHFERTSDGWNRQHGLKSYCYCGIFIVEMADPRSTAQDWRSWWMYANAIRTPSRHNSFNNSDIRIFSLSPFCSTKVICLIWTEPRNEWALIKNISVEMIQPTFFGNKFVQRSLWSRTFLVGFMSWIFGQDSIFIFLALAFVWSVIQFKYEEIILFYGHFLTIVNQFILYGSSQRAGAFFLCLTN